MIGLLGVQAVKQPIDDGAGVQQVADRTQQLGLLIRGGRGLQVSPGGRYQALAAVGQDQDQIKLTTAPHPPEEAQPSAFERVGTPDDRDLGRKALEMGSVSGFPSTPFHTHSS